MMFWIGLLLLSANGAMAAWNDFSPVPVNTSAGSPNVHWNSGARRIVRLNDVTFSLAPTAGGGDRIWRSANNGNTWTQIDPNGAFSGSLITGPDSMVYHFWVDRGADAIGMVRFKYNAAALPAPETVYSNSALGNTDVISEYGALNAAVDSNGVLYVASHWGAPDRIYVLRSADGGDTWQGPFQVSTDNSVKWNYMHMEVNTRNELMMVFHQNGGSEEATVFARSADQGATWTQVTVHSKTGSQYTANPALLTVGMDTAYIFVQAELSFPGVFVTRSVDRGATWGAFVLIERTCGYGDPSAGLGDDGKLYVAFRSSLNTGASGTCGDQSREKLAVSGDAGATWGAVDSLYSAQRVGTRSQVRYQTYWNYGGPLEWTWMQFDASGQPIYYDRNPDVQIRAHPATGSSPPPLRITTSALPAGTQGAAYSQSVQSAGGTGTKTWIKLSGTLPAGVALSTSGMLTGNPTGSGTFDFAVRVTDASGAIADASLRLIINLGNQPPLIDSLLFDKTSLGEGDSCQARIVAGWRSFDLFLDRRWRCPRLRHTLHLSSRFFRGG